VSFPIRSCSRVAWIAALAAAPALPAAAQGTQSGCGAQVIYIQDACQKAVDVFNFLSPQLGASIAGGSAVLGQTSALGGFPHFSLGLRVNGLRGALPRPQNVSLALGGRQPTAFLTDGRWVGLPTAEAAVGVFKGLPIGVTNIGGVDLIVSASYLPNVDDEDFGVRTSGGGLQLGYGARLGILQETAIVPGVSATYLRRELPTTNIVARVGRDSILVDDLDARTDSGACRLASASCCWASRSGAGRIATSPALARARSSTGPFPGCSARASTRATSPPRGRRSRAATCSAGSPSTFRSCAWPARSGARRADRSGPRSTRSATGGPTTRTPTGRWACACSSDDGGSARSGRRVRDAPRAGAGAARLGIDGAEPDGRRRRRSRR
jgi:hypothetical protein